MITKDAPIMRKVYLPIFLLILMTACSDKPAATKEPQKAESAGEIIDKYSKTLATAPDKARKAGEAVEARIGEDNKAAQEMEKQ